MEKLLETARPDEWETGERDEEEVQNSDSDHLVVNNN